MSYEKADALPDIWRSETGRDLVRASGVVVGRPLLS